MPIRQITIIGTGLIGGSLALALKKHGFRGTIIGCDRDRVLAKAKRHQAIDRGISDPLKSCQGSQLVVLATPVGAILDLLRRLAPRLSPDTFLTDVGSTKQAIVECAEQTFGTQAAERFLPGHPMAGKEHSGIELADPHLFRDAAWFFTPLAGPNLGSGIGREYVAWIKKLGARTAFLNPREHDQLCAWISHVPQMLATALAASLVEVYGGRAALLESGGRALREMTRIAASPYSMWRDIALTNKEPIANALLKVEQELAHIRENLDTGALKEEFERAHRLTCSNQKPSGQVRTGR
jgi:prephenate dehydrogenase